MSKRVVIVGLVVAMGAARAARAEAPGETAPIPVVAAPPSVLDHPWTVAASIGLEGLSVMPTPNTPAAVPVDEFTVASLAVRYRASRRWEFEAEIGDGTQNSGGGATGLTITNVACGVRYRFRPEHAWSWYLAAGVGVTTIVPSGADSTTRAADDRIYARGGFGIERRFTHLAVFLESQIVVTGLQDHPDGAGSSGIANPWTVMANHGLIGDEMQLGISYSL